MSAPVDGLLETVRDLLDRGMVNDADRGHADDLVNRMAKRDLTPANCLWLEKLAERRGARFVPPDKEP